MQEADRTVDELGEELEATVVTLKKSIMNLETNSENVKTIDEAVKDSANSGQQNEVFVEVEVIPEEVSGEYSANVGKWVKL